MFIPTAVCAVLAGPWFAKDWIGLNLHGIVFFFLGVGTGHFFLLKCVNALKICFSFHLEERN